MCRWKPSIPWDGNTIIYATKLIRSDSVRITIRRCLIRRYFQRQTTDISRHLDDPIRTQRWQAFINCWDAEPCDRIVVCFSCYPQIAKWTLWNYLKKRVSITAKLAGLLNQYRTAHFVCWGPLWQGKDRATSVSPPTRMARQSKWGLIKFHWIFENSSVTWVEIQLS